MCVGLLATSGLIRAPEIPGDSPLADPELWYTAGMVEKEIAKQIIDSLPDSATMDDIMHALYVRTKFERGEKEVREGKGIPHDEAKRRLGKWVK